jgi:hypothetical protein
VRRKGKRQKDAKTMDSENRGMEDWYDRIEEPLRELVRLLRNEGFNTTCSCDHLQNPTYNLSGMRMEISHASTTFYRRRAIEILESGFFGGMSDCLN